MAYAQMRDAGATYAQARASAPPLYDAGYSTAPGYQQGGMRAPQSQTMLSDDPTAGLGFLSGIDGLFIQERVELFEAFTGCDTNNVYHLTPIPAGALPDPVPPSGSNTSASRRTVDPCSRLARSPSAPSACAAPCTDPSAWTSATAPAPPSSPSIDRSDVPSTPPVSCATRRSSPSSTPRTAAAATAKEEFRPCWFCARSFVAADESGVENYRMRTSECGTSVGNNVCAPSCCNESYDVDVFDPRETTVVARATNAWPGWNCAGATDRSNVVLRFPKDASARERASLVAAMTLVEFAHFEWKKNDNEAGGPAAMFI